MTTIPKTTEGLRTPLLEMPSWILLVAFAMILNRTFKRSDEED